MSKALISIRKFLCAFGPVLAFRKIMKPPWNKYIIKVNGLLHPFENRWVCGISSSIVQSLIYLWLLKLIYSEKTTNFCEISTVDLSFIVTVKSTMDISQNFVAFSEYMNFNFTSANRCYYHCLWLVFEQKPNKVTHFSDQSYISLH